jgi:hypothetical protein
MNRHQVQVTDVILDDNEFCIAPEVLTFDQTGRADYLGDLDLRP